MNLGKWRNANASVKVARRNKSEFDRAIQELKERGYTVIWQHKTLNYAELKRL